MKYTKNILSFALGSAITASLFLTATPAFAAMVGKTIQVATGVNIYVDDQKLIKDRKGNNVEGFIYNGTTYVPIRAVAECFNADVGYVTEIRPKVRIVWVQDKSKTVKVSKSEAIKKATDLYFNDFLPEMRDYVLEYNHIDVNNITPSNIGEKSYFKYSGKCLADLGEYYYVEVLENAVGVLVDKYNGACYPVGGYSLGYLSISDDYGDTHWGIQWQ